MSPHALQRATHRQSSLVLVLAIALMSAYAWPSAQAPAPAKKALTVEDYPKWRSISGQEISGDGKWVAYGLQLTNVPQGETKPVLNLLNLETAQKVEVADATGATFSGDSRWLAYQIDPGGRGGRGGRRGGGGGGPGGGAPGANPPSTPDPQQPGTPPSATAPQGRGAAAAPAPSPRRAELRNLATGAVRSWQDIQTFTFAATSKHLLLRRRSPQPAGAGAGRGGDDGDSSPAQAPGGRGGGAAAPAGPRGVDVTIHNLATGRDIHLGSVGDAAFNKSGELLAYTVDAAVRDANGLFVLDLRNGRINPLDNDAKIYSRLAWNEAGTALAVLKGVEVEKMRERKNALLVFADVQATLGDAPEPAAVVLDPASAPGFPADWVVSERAALQWSDDNRRVFFGIKEQAPAPEANRRRDTNETADVDVWRTQDERIQSVQMVRAEADRNFTFRQAFDVPAAKYITLTDETMRDIDLSAVGKWAVGRDTRGYIHDFKRPAADFYRVDTTTGARTLMFKGQLAGSHVLGIAPSGRHFLYWQDSRLHAFDFDAASARALGSGVNFTDMEFDRPGPRPSYGIAGYTPDGTAAIAQHRYDLWLLPLDGSPARNLTNGAGTKGEIRFRYVRIDPIDPNEAAGPGAQPAGSAAGGGQATVTRQTIDLSKPIVLSAYGEYTKKAGFFELSNGQLRELVFDDASYSTPARAARADTYLFTRQTFVEFPDLRTSGYGFKASTRITDANPQQADYLWGRRVLFDYKNKDGVRLQGILALPDDYKAGEKRPMIVTFYEKNSQNMHRYSAPSYLTGMGSSPIEAVSRGYVTMLPDIHFRTGSSHSDMLECVEAAVRKVIEMGYVDPKRIGISGHSYGGEGAAFIGTRSKLFAAVGMGAGVTDLYSDFNQSWGWTYQVTGGSGANGHDYYMFGQGRWGFSPWDNPEVYRFESAITHANQAVAPFLIMHGTADPTVSFTEGMNFYQALRFHGKQAVMLAYPNEGHGLRGMANRKDLTVRFFEFFDHYLKGAPAPKWLTNGVPFIEKSR